MKKVLFFIFVTACLALFLSITGQGGPPKKPAHPVITTSFYPLYFFVSELGGNKLSVHNLTPAGAEPHDYELTSKDIVMIENSSMLVLNGGIEPWNGKLKNIVNNNTKIVTAGTGLFNTQNDPHIWLDPILAKEEVATITEALDSVDSQNSAFYLQNQKKLDSQFDELDLDYKHGLARCKNRFIVTSHSAFGYLAERYNLEQISLAGISPDEEPSSQDLTKAVDFIKQKNIKYVFFEKLVSPKLADTVASETGAKTLALDPLEGLTKEQLSGGSNYFSVMRDNLKNLQIALECEK